MRHPDDEDDRQIARTEERIAALEEFATLCLWAAALFGLAILGFGVIG
jgi:hypothetical protein